MMTKKKQQVLNTDRANRVLDDCIVQICCDWTKTAIFFFFFFLALQIRHKPAICHVVSYVCLSQQYIGPVGPI